MAYLGWVSSSGESVHHSGVAVAEADGRTTYRDMPAAGLSVRDAGPSVGLSRPPRADSVGRWMRRTPVRSPMRSTRSFGSTCPSRQMRSSPTAERVALRPSPALQRIQKV